MSKTTFTGYVPSLKAKHEATITNGKAIESKGGSIRYTIQGEYEGRKTFPKTVTKADFEGVYGFDAKEAESVIISGKKDDKTRVKGHIIGVKDKDDFVPEFIHPVEHKITDGRKIEGFDFVNHADTVGSPSPASVEPPAPSEKPFPQEPTNADFSATTERVIITLGDDDEEDEEEIEEETEDEDEDEEESPSDENGEEDDSDEEKDEKVEDEDEEQEEDDSEEEDEDEEEFEAISVEVEREKKEDKDEDEDEDGLLTPMNVALGLGAVALGVAVLGAEGEYICPHCSTDLEGDGLDLSEKFTCPSCDGVIYESMLSGGHWPGDFMAKGVAVFGAEECTTDWECYNCERCKAHCDCGIDKMERRKSMSKVYGQGLESALMCGDTLCKGAEDEPEPTFDDGITGQDGPSAEPTNADFSAEGVCGCGIDCDCDCGCAESGVCNCGESCPCDCGCGVESFGTDSLVEEPDWIPDGDGRALGQQNLDINLSPLHAEQNEYHTSNVFYADEDVQKMTSSEFVPFDQITSEIQQEWDETTAPIAADYEPSNEPTNANFSAEAEYVCEECDEPLHEDEVEWNVHYQDIDRLKQRIANGESAKNVIEDCHGVEYRVCENHKSNWREELMDYERRLYETETFEAGKHSGQRSRRKKQGIGSTSPSKARQTKYTDAGWRGANDRIAARQRGQEDLLDYERNKADLANQKIRAKIEAKEDLRDFKRHEQAENFSLEEGDELVGKCTITPNCKGMRMVLTEDAASLWCPTCLRTWDGSAETVGSPSPTFNEGITGQDGPSAEPTNENFSAEGGLSKNAQYAIGLAALGVGIALWNGDWVSKMFDRFKQ